GSDWDHAAVRLVYDAILVHGLVERAHECLRSGVAHLIWQARSFRSRLIGNQYRRSQDLAVRHGVNFDLPDDRPNDFALGAVAHQLDLGRHADAAIGPVYLDLTVDGAH